MTKRKFNRLKELLQRVRLATRLKGKKTDLAKFLGCPQPRVSEWLAETRFPGGEVALLMLEWVQAEEAKQQETLGGASNTTKGRKTRKLRTLSHEKSKQVRQKP